MDAFYHAASQLPGAVSQALMRIPPRWAGDITEIRLRSGRPVSLSTPSGARFVSIDGGWREKPDTGVLSTPHALVQNCFQAICGYSVHSFADCIANGFVPLPGGHRAGVCGTAFVDGSGTFTLKNITSINLRVARTGLCACDAVLRPLLCAPGVGLLIAGAPGSGKTTLLRDLIRQLSDRFGWRICVVDERLELAACASGVPQFRLGAHTDVLSGAPKAAGIELLLRTMNPEWIAVDEITAEADIAAIRRASYCGVRFLATAHAADRRELESRPLYRALLEDGFFRMAAFLLPDRSVRIERGLDHA